MSILLMDIYFTLWAIIQYYIIYCVAQIVPALSIGSSLGWILRPVVPMSLWQPPSCCFLNTSLLPGPIRCSRLISNFSAPVPESAISPRNPVSFYWRTVFRNQDTGIGCAPFVDRIKKYTYYTGRDIFINCKLSLMLLIQTWYHSSSSSVAYLCLRILVPRVLIYLLICLIIMPKIVSEFLCIYH